MFVGIEGLGKIFFNLKIVVGVDIFSVTCSAWKFAVARRIFDLFWFLRILIGQFQRALFYSSMHNSYNNSYTARPAEATKAKQDGTVLRVVTTILGINK